MTLAISHVEVRVEPGGWTVTVHYKQPVEPRILAQTLSVRAIESASVLDTHNMIEFEIRGQLWAQPVPLEILLRTRLDLEAGQVEVRDASATATPPRGR